MLLITILALVISIIGIPLLVLVPFGIILVGIVMLVGFTGVAHMVGGWTLQRLGRLEPNPYLTAAVGIVVIAGLTLIGRLVALAIGGLGVPFYVAGYFLEYLAWTVGFGAAIRTWLQIRRGPTTATMSTPAPAPGSA